MKVNVAESAGFCSGVKRALKIAAEVASRGGRVFMLGEIVHNEDVLRDIRESGIKRIRRLSKGSGTRTLLIPAHGVPLKTIRRAKELGYTIIDATCPMVKHIHGIAAGMERDGRRVIVIGDRDHSEVKGIVGQLAGRAIVIDAADRIPARTLRGISRAAVVVQSTQDADMASRIVAVLRTMIPDIVFHNTICRPTREKQKEIMSLARRSDVMVVIGSGTSANTRRLFEISRRCNRRTWWLASKDDLDPSWFKGAATVGVGAGASTPEVITRAVVEKLSAL